MKVRLFFIGVLLFCSLPASVPAKDGHYSMRDGQQYGYEQRLSTADKAQGVATKPLTMIHYLGFQDNTYQVAFGNPTNAPVDIAECSKPCEFVKIRRAPPVSLSESPQTIRAEKGTVLWAIMQDAMNGKLERAFIMDKTYHHEGVQVGQVVPSTIERHYFRAVGPVVRLIPASKLTGKSGAVAPAASATPSKPDVATGVVLGPSFDCSKASIFVEKAICSDPTLGKLDGALSQNYKRMLASNIGDGAKKDLRATQKQWLAERNKCTNKECLVNAHRKRVDEVCDYPVLSGVHPVCIAAADIK